MFPPREFRQSQRLAKELVLSKRLDGLEVGLAQAQQADHRCQHVSMRDLGPLAVAQADGIASALDAGSLQQGPRQGQTGMRNQDFVRLGNCEFHGLPFLTAEGDLEMPFIIHTIPARTSPFHALLVKKFTDSGII